MTENPDSPDFIRRIAGIYRDCKQLEAKAESIVTGVAKRIQNIQRNWFLRKVELGEELLAVQEARAGEFDDWLATHRCRLGFSRDTAYRCKAEALKVRELGVEGALLALDESKRSRPEPFLCLRLSLPVAPEQVPAEEIPALLKRIKPAVEIYQLLQQRAAAAA